MENLIEVKCPFKKRGAKTNKLYVCNRTCVKVMAGSAGEAYCRSCSLAFEFEVDSQAKATTGVRVKAVD